MAASCSPPPRPAGAPPHPAEKEERNQDDVTSRDEDPADADMKDANDEKETDDSCDEKAEHFGEMSKDKPSVVDGPAK